MKLLHVITSLKIGGAETLLVELAPLLKKRGFDLDVLLFNGEDSFLKETLIREKVNIISFSKKKSVYSIMNLYKLWKILPYYDIAHSHNTACQYYLVIAALIRKYKPILITTEHSTNNRRRELLFFKYVDKWMYTQYDAIISISIKTAFCLQKYIGSRINNLYTINNGINLEKYKKATVFPTNETRFVILMVAGFRKEKDQDTLIRSMVYLDERFVLWLVGDGVKKRDCELLVQKLNISNKVVFWGIRNDIPELLKASNVVVMSSHWEGFGLAAVEGMSVGKPVIASDVPGLAEVVSGAGVLFQKGDVKELADNITKLFCDRLYYECVSKACLERAQKYDINFMANQYVELYHNILKK